MEWSQFKLGVGPMSPNVVDSCLKYSKHYNYPLMFIASRNQADYQSGYAFNTEDLVRYIRSNRYYNSNLIKICRDHCGPYFSENDKYLSFDEILKSCKLTIKHDIENDFDLIHIDVSRVEIEKQNSLAHELVSYALSLNSDIALEFGSEDNTGQNLIDTIRTVEKQIEFAKQYKNNIKFLVNQTGSLTKHTQVGIFNQELCHQIACKIHNAGFLFKEHNADYLILDQIRNHKDYGVDAINIAPQLGYAHSLVIDKLSYNYKKELSLFKEYVLQKNLWKKWIVDSVQDDETKFLVSAHYFFNSEYMMLIDNIIETKKLPFEELLFDEISIILDQYRLGFGE